MNEEDLEAGVSVYCVHCDGRLDRLENPLLTSESTDEGFDGVKGDAC